MAVKAQEAETKEIRKHLQIFEIRGARVKKIPKTFHNSQAQHTMKLQSLKIFLAVLMAEKGTTELQKKARYTKSLQQFDKKRYPSRGKS